MKDLVSINKAAELLGVCNNTLREWEAQGKLVPVRTLGNHRRYSLSDIKELIGQTDEELKPDGVLAASYARVSSHEQKEKGDLGRQEQRLIKYCAERGYKLIKSLTDVGSGMSDHRPKLKTLFNMVVAGEINRVVVENKDRLTRFCFGVYEEFFKSHGVEIEVVEEKENKDYQQELVDDIVSLMASFSGRVYGMRSAERRKKK